MTVKVAPSLASDRASFPLVDRVLDGMTYCASSECQGKCRGEGLCVRSPCDWNIDNIDPWKDVPKGESILPHLRFQPISHGSNDDGSTSSSLRQFSRLFLDDDAPHSFRTFHEKNGDVDVNVGEWKDAGGLTSAETPLNPSSSQNFQQSTSESPRDHRNCTKMLRIITFTTNISPNSSASSLNDSVIPIGVTNTQTLSMHHRSLRGRRKRWWILESEFKFDFDSGSSGRLTPLGLGQLLISNDVKGTTVVVRVMLRESEACCDTGDSNQKQDKDSNSSHAHHTLGINACRQGLLKKSLEQEGEEQNSSSIWGYLSCLSHPLLLPSEFDLCGSTTDAVTPDDECAPANSSVDSDRQHSPAHIGASLLSAIKAKNLEGLEAKKSWTIPGGDVFNRYETDSAAFAAADTSKANGTPDRESQEDVLACTSRGTLKLKPIPSFEFARSPSTASCEGHVAMRRMILEKDGVITSKSPIHQRSAINDASTNKTARRGLSMRIDMNIIRPPSATSVASSRSTFSRSTSFTNIDEKVRKGLKKRVSRTWILWAESWCMRLWEEEESVARGNSEARGDTKKRKTNVRPTVRRIKDAGSRNSSSNSLSRQPSDWNTFHNVDSSTNWRERWMFLEYDGYASDEEECGVEVDCTIISPQVRSKPASRKNDVESTMRQFSRKVVHKKKGIKLERCSTASAQGVKSNKWSISPKKKSNRVISSGR